MKKMIALSLVAAMLLSFSVSAFADVSEKNTNNLANEVSNSEYLPNVIYVEDGIPRQITQEEYNRLTTQEEEVSIEDHSSSSISPRQISYWRYTASSNRTSLDSSLKKAVTAQVRGPASVSYGTSASFSATFSVSLTSAQISSILSNIGTSYARSATSNTSFSTVFPIPDGKIKRVYFTPRILETRGKLQYYVQGESEANPRPSGSPKSVTARFPKKIGNFADGLYELGD